MPQLLLELFSEEIPARMQAEAAAHLGAALEKSLGAKAKMFVTPRRLAAIIENLPEKQPDLNEELKGPKVGAPDAAMAGFLKKTGLALEQLEQRDGVYFARIELKGKPTAEMLKPLIEEMLAKFPWPKSMRWGSGETAWVRPLHSIMCLFDGNVVPIEFAGVKANNFTFGHRFLAPEKIIIREAKQYESALENAKVIADRDKRKAVIATQLEEKCKSLGVALHADVGLLEEVTGLVEWPNILSGKIDASYMDLPEEVLILEMKNHQKYFATREPSPTGRGQGEGPHPNLLPEGEGALSPHFLITSNMVTADGGKAIVAGNERVLRARFADGRFFWDTDRKTKLEDFAAKLKDVTYHAKLGSSADKVARVAQLAGVLAQSLGADKTQVARAVALAKADLVSGMVGEFPELQGVMGRYYALHQGEKAEVADAIRDHYKPQGPSDSVPKALVSICVALADKLDTLISMFAIGEKPTGSKDPFALRRAALGVIRIVLENNLRLPLLPLFQNAPLRAIATHQAQEKLVKQTEEKLHDPEHVGKYLTLNETACSDIPEGAAAKIAAELLAFFHDRLIVQLKDQGIRHDVIKAVVASGDDDLVRIVARAKALQEFLNSQNGKNLLAAYKRAANIVGIEEKKDKTNYSAEKLDTNILEDENEKLLSMFLGNSVTELTDALESERFDDAMDELATLRAPVDTFFETVMVNCENPALRVERLRLLARIRDVMDSIADFSKIEG
jgi:glycyl-tRNA synthetase beta chain